MSRSIWATSAIEFKDLPTLRDLFRVADKDLLANAIFEVHVLPEFGEKVSKRERKTALRRLKKTLHSMGKTKVKASKKWCLFPEYIFRSDWEQERIRFECIKSELHVSLIRRKDFGKAEAELACQSDAIGNEEECARVKRYSFLFTKRKKVLGYRVWLRGLESRKERYLFLARAFWDMTFFGLDQKKSDKRIRKEARIIDKASKCTKAYPLEVVSMHIGCPDAGSLGLEKSTDDYEEEYEQSMRNLIQTLNQTSRDGLLRSIVDLDAMLAKGYSIR